jgi:DNA-binding NarL/FixJ family response regulator
MKLVIAEELALVREGLVSLCVRDGGHEVAGQAADGEEACRLVRELRPDAAILDIGVPRMFALEAIRLLRSEGLETCFAVLSLRQDRKSVLEALRAGAQAFILKSSPASSLLEGLEQIRHGTIYVSPEIDLQHVFAPERAGPVGDPLAGLSAREYQVFSLLVEGTRAKEIAARLNLSPKTVDTYRSSLMRKLGIHDLAGLVKFAVQKRLTAAE